MDNRTILQKADMALADLTSGGALAEEHAAAFIRGLIEHAMIMPMATVIPMRSPKQVIDKIKFGSRILRAAKEAQALSQAERAKPTTSDVELDAQLFKAEVRISDEILEDNIERSNFHDTIISLMTERISTDVDDILANGDTTSADPFYSTLDGIRKQAVSHTVNAGAASLSKTILKRIVKAMPKQYKRVKKELVFMCATAAEEDYRDTLASRATAAGDKYLEGDAPILYNGSPLSQVPMFPETLGGGNESDLIYTHPKNVHVGVLRRIKLETDKDISAGVLVIVATLRLDVKYAEEDAVVKATNIAVS